MKTKKTQTRTARFMPGGVPRYVRCYALPDDGSFDRFTVVFTGRASAMRSPGTATQWPYLCLSGHGHTYDQPADRPTSRHLGRRVPFSAMPDGLRRTALEDYREIWGLETAK